MRLDKYLKVSRIIKRRALAKEASESERVYVNGNIAKPSKAIKVGDIITIHFGKKEVTIKVLTLNQSTKKEDAALMFELIEEKELVG